MQKPFDRHADGGLAYSTHKVEGGAVGRLDKASLGERIANLRGARGLSQEALAERVHVSRQTISNWGTEGAKTV